MPIKKIKQKTVVEQVMSKIKDLIATGTYSPGDKIPTEHELAISFGVGRSSIREAIKIFNYLGVLESRTAKGTFVRERSGISVEALTWSMLLGEDELNEMIDLWGSIEIWAMFNLTDKIDKSQMDYKDLSKIPSEHKEMLNALLSGDKSIVYSAYSDHISNIKERLRNR